MQSNQMNIDEALAASLLYDHPELTIYDGVTTLQLQQEEEDYKEACRVSLAADEALAKELQDMEGHPQISLSDDENYARLLQDEEYMTNPVALTDDVNQVTNQFQVLEVNRSSSVHGESSLSLGSSSHSNQSLPPNDDIDPENMSYEELTELGESMGKVSKGLSKKKIDKLKTHKFGETSSWFKKKVDVAEDSKCSICLTELKRGDTLSTLPCGHTYHKDCISQWLEDNKICCVCTVEVSL